MPAERKSPTVPLVETQAVVNRREQLLLRQRDELREIVGEYLACSAFRSIHPQSREGRNRNRAIELLAKLDEGEEGT